MQRLRVSFDTASGQAKGGWCRRFLLTKALHLAYFSAKCSVGIENGCFFEIDI